MECQVDWCNRECYGNQLVCSKHYQQQKTFGRVKRTKFDPNEFSFIGNVCMIHLYDASGNPKNKALIDREDYIKCRDYKWCQYSNQVVGTVIEKKHTYLHHFLLGGIVDKEEISHINSNLLDNRKVNLKRVDRYSNPLRKHTEETRKKMSFSKIGKKCPWVSKLYKGRVSPTKGLKWTEEQKNKLRGRTPWNKGVPCSEETKEKLRLKNSGSNSHFWKGGVWVNNTRSAKVRTEKLRRQRKRDNGGSFSPIQWQKLKAQYKNHCLCCGDKETEHKKLTADHIIPISKGGSSYIDNIQPLCKKCNARKATKIINYRR